MYGHLRHVACQPSNYPGISGHRPNSRCQFHASYHFKTHPRRSDHLPRSVFLCRAFYFQATLPNRHGHRPTYRCLYLEFYCHSKSLCTPTHPTIRRFPHRVFSLFCIALGMLTGPTRFLSLNHPKDRQSTNPRTCCHSRCSKCRNHSLCQRPIPLRRHPRQHEKRFLGHALNCHSIPPRNERHQATVILRSHVSDCFSIGRCI